MKFRIGGVCNSNIIDPLRSHGISSFKFDLRPRSFNFTQLSNIKDIIANYLSESSADIFLCFEDDAKITIQESVKYMKESSGHSNLYLEFYKDLQEASFYESFGVKYYLHIDSSFKVDKLKDLKNLAGLVVSNRTIEQLLAFDQAHDFLKKLELSKSEFVKLDILLDWDEEMNSSIFDFYKIDSISMDVSSKIETSFQNINFELMNQILTYNIGGTSENTTDK